jgi:hypothetical protein
MNGFRVPNSDLVSGRYFNLYFLFVKEGTP